MRRNGRKLRWLFGTVAIVVGFDRVTKYAIQQSFQLYDRVDVLGDFIRLTYIHNPGAAFGLHLGPNSRLIFTALSLFALAVLVAMYWYTPVTDRARLLAIALICGGALGNLVDRFQSAAGVVDFLDVGLGDLRWPVFNVADVAVTTGAIVLALSLWQEDRRIERSG